MGTFAQIAKGARARKRGVKFTSLTGQECVCDIRILSGKDDEEHLARAGSIARAAGAEPNEKDVVFYFARACEVVAAACIDPDSPEDAPRPFFTSADEVKAGLDRERIFLLYEQQIQFQESVSPRKRNLTAEEYVATIFAVANAGDDEELPFVDWAPSSVWSWARFTARLCISSLGLKSDSSSDSGEKDGVTSGPTPAS